MIATKVGRLLDEGPDGEVAARFDFGYDAVRRSLDSSLDRLGVDRVDIVHIHDPDDHLDAAVDGAHRGLVDLRDQGVIDAVSVGTNSVETAATFLDGAISTASWSPAVHAARPDRAPVIRQCAERGIAYLAAGVFNSGVLARPSDEAWYDYAPVPRRRSIGPADRADVPAPRRDLAAAALSFVLAHPDVTVVIVGMATPDEVDENLGAAVPKSPMASGPSSPIGPGRATTTEEGSR